MTSPLRVVLAGTPRPWVRPQRAGGYARKQKLKSGKWVDPPGVLHLEILKEYVAAEVALERRWDPTRPVEVEVSFVFGIGKNRDEAKTIFTVRPLEEMADGAWRTKVPDVDNLLKLIGEALQHGGALVDDSQIVRVIAEKVEFA